MELQNENMGLLLALICKAHRNLAQERFNQLGLHAGQELVILQLGNSDGMRPSELGDVLCVEPPTITRTLQRMEKGGFVERKPDPDDARASLISATTRSKALRGTILQVWDDLEVQLLAGLTGAEQALLRRLLIQLYQNLAQPELE